MHTCSVKAAFDLGAPVRSKDEAVRLALLQLLQQHPEADRWRGFEHGGQRFNPIAGTLVQADFGEYSYRPGDWEPYKGLVTRWVRLSESGTDHFPVAGLYRSGATYATVKYKLERDGAVSEDFVKHLIQIAYDDARYRSECRLVVPFVQWRTWSLILTAPSFSQALRGYERLRAGIWTPAIRFSDALTNEQKVHLLDHTVEPFGDEADEG